MLQMNRDSDTGSESVRVIRAGFGPQDRRGSRSSTGSREWYRTDITSAAVKLPCTASNFVHCAIVTKVKIVRS